jgi:hypothetical protein
MIRKYTYIAVAGIAVAYTLANVVDLNPTNRHNE